MDIVGILVGIISLLAVILIVGCVYGSKVKDKIGNEKSPREESYNCRAEKKDVELEKKDLEAKTLAELEKELADTEKELAETEKEIAETEKEIAELDEKLADTEKEIAELTNVLAFLEENIDKRKDKNVLDKKKPIESKRIADLKPMIADWKRANAELEKEIAECGAGEYKVLAKKKEKMINHLVELLGSVFPNQEVLKNIRKAYFSPHRGTLTWYSMLVLIVSDFDYDDIDKIFKNGNKKEKAETEKVNNTGDKNQIPKSIYEQKIMRKHVNSERIKRYLNGL